MQDSADVDAYLANSDQWPDEIAAIRPILLSCGLGETMSPDKVVPRILDGKGLRDR